MSALADIFTAVRLTLDGTGFEAQALALADRSGKNVGDRLSQQLSGKLKSAALGGMGALGGAGLSAAISGANELDAAMRQLQADTGMTDAAAKLAEHSIAGMYGNNLQGIGEIGKTLAVVINGLDLTGAAADAMTEKFLKFETATGQDSSAVSAFHEILNAWGLDASSAQHIMDLLVASHQKYGSSVVDNQASLQRLAPQMKAMNMTIDDTVNLLNLFDAAGLDASKAQFALNTAVKNLKPGQTFNDLIAQVTAIEDPTLRAQEAIKIFGARGGVGLANALKPGIQSLADFATSADDTAGASEKAAGRIEASIGNQAVKVLHGLKGVLADFATTLGVGGDSVLMAAALLGPRLATALLAGIGGVGGLLVPRLAGLLTADVMPWMTAGTKIGTIIGAAIGPAMAIAAVAAVALVWDSINKDLNKQADALQVQTTEWAKTATVEQLKAQREVILQGISDIANMPLGQLLYGDQLASLKRQYDVATAAIADRAATGNIGAGSEFGKNFTTGVASGIAAGTPKILAAVKDWFSGDELFALFRTDMTGSIAAAAADAGKGAMGALAAAIVANQQTPIDAYQTMLDLMKKTPTATQEAARLAGSLISGELASGLSDGRPAVHAQAIEAKRDIYTRLMELVKSGQPLGKEAMAELAKGMKSKNDDVAAAATLVYNAAMDVLKGAKTGARTAGVAAGSAFASGVKAGSGSTWNLLLGKPSQTQFEQGRAGGGSVTAGMPYIVGEHRPELFVPQTNGYILPSVPAGRGMNVNIEHVEIADAHDEFSLTQSLRFLAAVQG